MSSKPIFVATHPRACSTAFERVFMTRRDTLQCVHEPFGDAYYYGPERLAERYDKDEQTRLESGFSESTFKTIMDRINRENTEGKRLLIKDMAQYFVPPNGKPPSIAPSLFSRKKGIGTIPPITNGDTGSHFNTQTPFEEIEPNATAAPTDAPYPTFTETENPTVVPSALLGQFHFAFLIRHPKNSIPSYYRCCIPPLEDMTGFHGFRSDEAGYGELRSLFDYLRRLGHVGPNLAGKDDRVDHANGHITNGGSVAPKVDICVIDADDLLDNPAGIISTFCESVGIEFSPKMLNWDTEEDHVAATEAFEKWKGFHEDAINSKDLKPRSHKHEKSTEEYYSEWTGKYGDEAAKTIQKSVDADIEDYEYLKSFAIRV